MTAKTRAKRTKKRAGAILRGPAPARVPATKPAQSANSVPALPTDGGQPLRLEWRTAAELEANPLNWRTHGDTQLSALRDVIDSVGWAGVVLVNSVSGRMIDGHARRNIARPDERLPVLVGSWSEEQERTILATLDPIAALATADSAKLEALLASVRTDSAALQEMFAGLRAENALPVTPGGGGDDFDSEAALPAAGGPTRTQSGELWVIGGKHRLLVGDCTDPANVALAMNGQRASIMNTDPPYGVDYSDSARVAADRTHVRPQRERKWEDHAIDNDGVDGPKLQAFLESAIRAAVPHLAENAAYYLWHPMLTQGTFFAAAAAADILIHRQIIWVKPVLLFGFGDYHWKHELCFYGWRRGHRPVFYGERNQTTIWEVTPDTSNADRVHPTQKPLELFNRPMLNHTVPGGVIYEPFAGSGSQYISAHRLGRICHGCELNPRWADCILARCEAEGLSVEKAA